MLCFLCGKKIGFMRSLFDQHYCSADHRREARMASANCLRDEEDIEPWTVARSKDKKKTLGRPTATVQGDRKSTRLNSSHVEISYAVFCLKKKKKKKKQQNI